MDLLMLLIYIYLLFVLVIAIVIEAVWGIARSRQLAILLSIYVALGLALLGAWKYDERQVALSMVPDALGVSAISYLKEESLGYWWFPLPGDNEFGVAVYPLSEQVAQQIRTQGPAFFATMAPNASPAGREWRGVYDKWHKTPIVSTVGVGSEQNSFPLNLTEDDPERSFRIDPAIGIQLRRILRSPDAYYAYGRVGMIVVSPAERLVVFMYSG